MISTVICLSVFLEAFAGTVTAADMLLQKIVVLTDAVFPVVTGFLSLAGDISGTAFLSPMAGFVSTATAGIMKKWGVFICCAAAACASGCGFAGSLRLDGLFSLLRTAAVWLTGGIMTMFIAILSIQGLLGRSYDSAAMRTAQYAVDHALPVIGGGISDSLGTILSSISMIKAASGATGMLIIITACMEPIAEIWLTGFALKLAAAAASPIGYTDIISTAERFSQAATMLLTICIASAAMALMLLGAAISAGRGML